MQRSDSVVTCPTGLIQDQVVSVAEYSRTALPVPVAVGTMAIHSDQMNDNTKGKAVYMLQVAGGELWSMGSKATAPDLGPKQPQQLDKEEPPAEPQQQAIDEMPGTAEPSQG